MIVIKARGARDVNTLRRLASELSATTLSGVETDIAPQEPDTVSQRRRRRPSVNVLPSASISLQTQAALADLMPVTVEKNGEYDFL